jgi:hypothetical protein
MTKEKIVVSFIWQHHVPILWWPKNFNRCKIVDWNLFSVTNYNKGNSNVTKDFLVSVLTNMTNVSRRMPTWHPMQNGHVTSISTTLASVMHCDWKQIQLSQHWKLNSEFSYHWTKRLKIFNHQLAITIVNDQKNLVCLKTIWELPKKI